MQEYDLSINRHTDEHGDISIEKPEDPEQTSSSADWNSWEAAVWVKIPLTAASFVYAAGNEQPQKNELKPGYEMLYYIAQQRDWEAAEIVFAYFLAALESDADKQAFTKLYEENHIHMEQAAMRILKDQTDAEDAMQNAFV